MSDEYDHDDLKQLISVGIDCAERFDVTFHTPYIIDGKRMEGRRMLSPGCGRLSFVPAAPGGSFTLHGARIGRGFHWERRLDLTFEGELHLTPAGPDGMAWLVNRVDVEAYLCSVISSEMSAKASDALLRAHAVISRTWAYNRIFPVKGRPLPPPPSPERVVTWWDENDHTLFHVCNDDHCQRYQGMADIDSRVAAAVAATAGLTLRDPEDGSLVDARFSKCCGGVTEEFSTCWEDTKRHRCLRAFVDAPGNPPVPELRSEEGAARWIAGNPQCFCNTHDPAVLGAVLKDYDRETSDFFRWKVTMTQAEARSHMQRAVGIDPGEIRRLTALERGPSGRIKYLEVEGSEHTFVIGKELLIRKALSPSHLYSSAFTAELSAASITLHGAGWGHGVGLCQIGAAMMGELGYGWREILQHYYPGAVIR